MDSIDKCNIELVKELKAKDGHIQKNLFAKLIWKDNDTDIFHITIIDSDNCYTGRFSRQFATEFRKETVETEEEYIENLRKGLFDDNDIGIFTYELENLSNNSAKFSWKKRYMKSDVVMLHGSVPLHENKDVTKDMILHFLIDKNKQYKNEIQTLSKKLQTAESELLKSEADLKQLHLTQSTLEQTLYGKFVNLLNSKKRRISVLEESLHHLTKSSINN